MTVAVKQSIKEPCGLSLDQLRAVPDDLVMAHLSSGHDDALAVLFERYHRLVIKIALKIVRDAGEAEDVMQNVFLEIYKVAAQFDPARGSTKVWMLQYAYHRSMTRRQQLISRKFYSNTDISEAQDHAYWPAHSALASPEVQRLVRQALETLNDVQRRVLELAYFEGFSLKEIADETGESLGNVRHHYYRGLNNLRTVVDAEKQTAAYRTKEIADASA